METKFKGGDRVCGIGEQSGESIDGMFGTIRSVATNDAAVEFDEGKRWMHGCGGLTKMAHGWHVDVSNLRLVTKGKGAESKASVPKCILQYELDSDPFEVFVSEKDLRARITELATNPSLKRESMKVYTIKSVRSVKLGVKSQLI